MTTCISDKVKAALLEDAVQVNASAQTASVDLMDIANQGMRVKLDTITALAAGVNDIEVQLQHSDDDSVFTDVEYAPSKLMSSLALGEEMSLPYEGIKRYLRLSYVAVGSPDVTVDSYAILQPNHLPA